MSTDEPEYLEYTRLSKGRASIRRQRTIIGVHLGKRGGRIIDRFSDADRSAYRKPGGDRPERPDFDRMIAVLRARRGLRIIAWHADRLLRDQEDTGILSRVCAEGGHIIVTPSGGEYDLSTANGRRRLRDDASAAEYEVDHLRERVLESKIEARAAGLWLGGARPFGWLRGDELGELLLHPDEAPAVAAADLRIISGGALAAIARDWNTAGLTTVAGNPWSATKVRGVLLRESNWAPPPARWPSLVDETTHRAVVAILNDPARKTTPGPEPQHLMSGIMRCGVKDCGMSVFVRGSSVTRGGKVYRCGTVSEPGSKGARLHVSRDKEFVDEFVGETVIARFERDDAAALLQRPAESELPALDMQRAALTVAMTASNDLRRRGLLTITEFATERAEHQQRLAELDQRIAVARAANVCAPMLREPRATWKAMTIDQRRAVVRELATWTLLPQRRGRPRGWKPGMPYFDPESISIDWHSGTA